HNTAGCSVLMMIAEALSHYRLPVDIYYCFLAGNMLIEDEFIPIPLLLGAKQVSEILVDQGVEVVGYLNFDQLTFYDDEQPEEDRIHIEHKMRTSPSYQFSEYLADVFLSFMQRSGQNIATTVVNHHRMEDHKPFWDLGLPAINIFGGQEVDWGNATIDDQTSEYYNEEQALLVGRAAAATVVYLGMKGNGHNTTHRLETVVASDTSVHLKTALSLTQTVTISGRVNGSKPLELRVYNETHLLYWTLIAHNFSETCEINDLGQIAIELNNPENETISVVVNLIYASDSDGNHIIDAEDYAWPEPVPALDWDSDYLTDEEETIYGTDIFVRDTDRDKILDGIETMYGLDPLRDDAYEDPDEDDLSSLRETRIGTHPLLNDSDADKVSDGWEVRFRTDPLTNDSYLDLDGDNLTNLEEYLFKSNPKHIDGDHDGLLDPEEAIYGTDALDFDTDDDGISDRLEIMEGLDPLKYDSDLDFASDGSDSNPRVNMVIVFALLGLGPVLLGTFIFKRRLQL
ncbi:MAG: hypothetical protein RTU92_08030, partial [Candidatus Thorarchaeota archaeon]